MLCLPAWPALRQGEANAAEPFQYLYRTLLRPRAQESFENVRSRMLVAKPGPLPAGIPNGPPDDLRRQFVATADLTTQESRNIRIAEGLARGGRRAKTFRQQSLRFGNPTRIDHLACAVGNAVVGIETTWSGPAARSLLKNSSLDLLITFKAKAGYEPVLLYSPSWYDGTIRIRQPSTTTTKAT